MSATGHNHFWKRPITKCPIQEMSFPRHSGQDKSMLRDIRFPQTNSFTRKVINTNRAISIIEPILITTLCRFACLANIAQSQREGHYNDYPTKSLAVARKPDKEIKDNFYIHYVYRHYIGKQVSIQYIIVVHQQDLYEYVFKSNCL